MFDPLYLAVSAIVRAWHVPLGLLFGPTSGVGWALAIVLLVVTLRAALLPLVLVQMRSARRSAALAPRIAQLRERHAADPARLLAEIRDLRRAEGVSMWGGLLPALAQLPVFLGLLHVLRTPATLGTDAAAFLAARLGDVPLTSWATMPQALLDAAGATRPEVLLVAVPLLVLAGVATGLALRASAAAAPALRPLVRLAPAGVLAAGLLGPFPIAILLYWLVANLWTLAQQRFLAAPSP